MTRLRYLIGLSLPAYLTALAAYQGQELTAALRALLLICLLAFLAGVAGWAGMFERTER